MHFLNMHDIILVGDDIDVIKLIYKIMLYLLKTKWNEWRKDKKITVDE